VYGLKRNVCIDVPDVQMPAARKRVELWYASVICAYEKGAQRY
jgi:hypothetical protein